jgi:hypothetical protein
VIAGCSLAEFVKKYNTSLLWPRKRAWTKAKIAAVISAQAQAGIQ